MSVGTSPRALLLPATSRTLPSREVPPEAASTTQVPLPHHRAFSFSNLTFRACSRRPQADGTLAQDRDGGFCFQTAVSCTVAKRDFAARKLAAQRPSAKMVRSEISDELLAKRGVWNQKKRA